MAHAPVDPVKKQLLDAALPHVVFDGWSDATFDAAVAEVGINPDHARTLCPRGAVDLAILFHEEGDRAMVAAIKDADFTDMRFRDKVAKAIRLRLAAVPDKEIVRRGTTLFALPHLAADGARLIWGTADAIWTALGDTSDDLNWYSKRSILSAVYASTILFWLGDTSPDDAATDAFIDRRIENVMQFEKVKAQINANPALKPLTGALGRMAAAIKAPRRMPDMNDLPGMWRDPS